MEFESGFFVFALMVVVGALCGLLYDILRALEKPLRIRGLLAFLSDVAFWLAVAGMVSATVLLVAGGELRVVFVVAAALGSLLYFTGVSPWLLPPMCSLTVGACRILVRGGQRVLYVLGLPVRGVGAIRRAVARVTGSVAGKLSLPWLFGGAAGKE